MAEQPLQGGQSAAHTQTMTRGAAVYNGLQQCPNCSAVTRQGASVCQECGEELNRRPRQIRCRNCHHSASTALVLCPACGRELQAAPPRLLTWGLPALLAILFFALLANRWQSADPIQWAQSQGERLNALVAGVDTGMEPVDFIAVTAPLREAGSATADDSGDNAAKENLAVALAPTATAAAIAASSTPEPTATELPTALPTEIPTEIPTAEPTQAPTATPEPTATAEATFTATAGATATAAPTQSPTQTAVGSATSARQSAAASQARAAITLPTATATARASEPASSTPAVADVESAGIGGAVNTIYIIQSGDTLLGVARQFGVSAQAIMDVNDIDPGDVYTIRPGQELIIPAGSDGRENAAATPAAATPTSAPTASPTPLPTFTPEPTPIVLRLDTPRLRSPESGATVSCTGESALAWEQVPFIQPVDRFILHLGFVSARSDSGEESVTWILQQPVPSNRTAWNMDNDLCALAPQELNRQWRWYVEVVDEAGTPVSQTSDVWGFTWN